MDKKRLIAPHEGDELNLVMLGVKPLASIDKNKQGAMFNKAMMMQNVLSIAVHSKTKLTVTKAVNRHLHGVYVTLTRTPKLLAASQKQKHELLGRLFGYSEECIAAYIKNPPVCTCDECNWPE